MEPAWTKSISNETVCGFYYAYFWLRLAIAVMVLISLGFTFTRKDKIPFGILFVVTTTQLLMLALVLTDSLFQYLICDRAIVQKKNERKDRIE